MSENARARIERFEQDILLLQTRLANLEAEVARLGGKPLRYAPEEVAVALLRANDPFRARVLQLLADLQAALDAYDAEVGG